MRKSNFYVIMILVTMLLIGVNYVFAEDALFVDENGNVGIGTAEPDANLNVQDGTDVTLSGGGYIISGDLSGKNISIDDNEIMAKNNGSTSPLYIQNEGGDTILNRNGGKVGIGNNNPETHLDVSGLIRARRALIITGTGPGGGYPDGSMWYQYQDSSGDLHIARNGWDPKIELIRSTGAIFLNGNVGISRTPSYKLDVNGTLRVKTTIYTSDERLKKNIKNIDRALDQITSIQGVSYEWKDTSLDEKKHMGVLASEIEAIYPELVYTDDEGIKSVDYVGMIAPMIEAMKELKAENDELKDRLEEIEDILASMEPENDKK